MERTHNARELMTLLKGIYKELTQRFIASTRQQLYPNFQN